MLLLSCSSVQDQRPQQQQQHLHHDHHLHHHGLQLCGLHLTGGAARPPVCCRNVLECFTLIHPLNKRGREVRDRGCGGGAGLYHLTEAGWGGSQEGRGREGLGGVTPQTAAEGTNKVPPEENQHNSAKPATFQRKQHTTQPANHVTLLPSVNFNQSI